MKLEAEETEVDWFDLSLAVQVDDLELTPEEIKLLVNAKGGWVRLEDKGWRRLDYALSAEDDKQLAHLGLNPRALDTEPQRIHALQLANPAANKFLPAAQVEQLQLRAEEIQARVTPDIPASISAELRPYQTDGFHFLSYLSANNFGGILADDMGLGKTLQTLTWLIWLREQGETGPSLVVCPKSVMDNWQAEAKRFTTGLRTYIWPPGEVDQLPDRLGEADLHVINYNQLRKLGESLLPIRFLTAILDEGQYIKNPSSQTAQIARALNAAHRLVLTGTPIENRLLDLWSLMTFAMPGILGSRAQFGKLYNAKDDPFARLRLSSRVRPFLIRRTKSQVAQDLPERIEEDLYCEIEGEQKKLYQAERKRAQQILLGIKTQKQLNELRFNFLTSLLHLRQICCHPKLFRKDSRAKSAKLEAVMEQLETIIDEGAKVLVFSQFVELLELIQPELEKKGWPIWKLTGRTENRGQLVESFQNQEGPGVFLISLKAGGAGLNLTAASYVVLFDPWWNPAVENQAIDRTHRIGQTSKVIAYRLLIKNSIEEKIRELQKGKQALAEDVLGEEKFSQSLSMDDFQYLLGD
jgi:SNF2 family DNA or RNA helicase